MRISDWSSDVCSSDLLARGRHPEAEMGRYLTDAGYANIAPLLGEVPQVEADGASTVLAVVQGYVHNQGRSEEHTSELQSLMRISYAVFCLNKQHAYLPAPPRPRAPHPARTPQAPDFTTSDIPTIYP